MTAFRRYPPRGAQPCCRAPACAGSRGDRAVLHQMVVMIVGRSWTATEQTMLAMAAAAAMLP